MDAHIIIIWNNFKKMKKKKKKWKGQLKMGLPSTGGIAAKRIVVSIVFIPIGCNNNDGGGRRRGEKQKK